MASTPTWLRRWVRDAELGPAKPASVVPAAKPPAAATPTFMPVQLPATGTATGDIRVELRRGPTSVVVTWPVVAAGECAAWMRELLR